MNYVNTQFFSAANFRFDPIFLLFHLKVIVGDSKDIFKFLGIYLFVISLVKEKT